MFLCQTQTVGCGAYMTRMRHHTKHEPAYYHVYTSCSCLCSGSWSCLHFTWWAWNPFKQGTSHLKIWICIYSPEWQNSALIFFCLVSSIFLQNNIGWKIWGVPKNLGNSYDDGHWNFSIWTNGSWENADKRFQLAFWNLVQNHLL